MSFRSSIIQWMLSSEYTQHTDVRAYDKIRKLWLQISPNTSQTKKKSVRTSTWVPKKRSCETHIYVVGELAKSMKTVKQTELILLDFSKAFGKVAREKLFSNLHYYCTRVGDSKLDQGKRAVVVDKFRQYRSLIQCPAGLCSYCS